MTHHTSSTHYPYRKHTGVGNILTPEAMIRFMVTPINTSSTAIAHLVFTTSDEHWKTHFLLHSYYHQTFDIIVSAVVTNNIISVFQFKSTKPDPPDAH